MTFEFLLEWCVYTGIFTYNLTKKKEVNRDAHIASSPISQSCFFEEVRCLILASSQRKLRGYIEFLKFDVTIKKIKKIQYSPKI